MKVEFKCDNCGKAIAASSEHAGKSTRCPGCQSPVVIPSPSNGQLLDDELATAETLAGNPGLSEEAAPSATPRKIWHYSQGGTSNGPISKEELLSLQQRGVIKSETLLWKDGMADWVAAGKVLAGQPPVLPGKAKSETYCRNCGKKVLEKAVVCTSCGCPPQGGKEFCRHCGKSTPATAVVCINCGGSLGGGRSGINVPEKHMTAFFLCLFLGGFAGHRFYLKNENAAVMLLVSIFTFGIAGYIWSLIDLLQIAKGEFCDGEGVPIGAPVNWMVTVSWVCIGLGIFFGLMILLGGCAGILGG